MVANTWRTVQQYRVVVPTLQCWLCVKQRQRYCTRTYCSVVVVQRRYSPAVGIDTVDTYSVKVTGTAPLPSKSVKVVPSFTSLNGLWKS